MLLSVPAFAVSPSVEQTLRRKADENPKSALSLFIRAIERFTTDEVVAEAADQRLVPVYGRDKEIDQVFDTLVRIKGKNPVLVGEPGVGKTAIAEGIAQNIRAGLVPQAPAFADLKNAVVVEVSASSISDLAESSSKNAQQNVMRSFLKGLKEAEAKLGRPIIVYMDEMHTLQSAALQVLKTSMEARNGILFLGSTTHSEFNQMVQSDDAMRNRLHPVNVREFSPDETVEVLKRSWVPVLEKEYNVKITDSALRAAIRVAPSYDSFGSRPRAPFKVLQSTVVRAHREANGAPVEITEKTVGKQIVHEFDLKLDPADRVQFRSQLEELKNELRERVVDQERVTDKMVDLWRDLNQGTGKNHRVMLIAGPTGAGKTFSAKAFAQLALGSEDRLLEIDMAQFSYGGHSGNTLVGAPPGTYSSEHSAGEIPDFLVGRGRGQNVIIFNEFDKAHPDTANILMEMLDTGKLKSRNGKSYSLGKSLVIFTTNKGDDAIYPRGRIRPLPRKEIEERLSKIGDREIRSYFMRPNSNDLNDKSKTLPASILNRIDASVPAAPPSYEGAIKIALQEAKKISENLRSQYGFTVQLSPEVAELLVHSSYVPEDGVRDLNRHVEKTINQSIAAFEAQGEPAGTIPEGEILQIELDSSSSTDHPQLHISLSASGSQQKIFPKNPGGLRLLFSKPESPDSVTAAEAKSTKTGVTFDPPSPPNRVSNPLVDPEARAKLASLEERLERHVFGQPEAVKASAKSIRLRSTNTQTRTPAVTLELGPTGVGKTELGKAIAKELFEDEERHISFDMGKIKTQAELNEIFGVSPGYVGSGNMSPFEQFLNTYPDGGVITFDEIGNMGGSKGEGRESLLKYFYSMLDEGEWRSPQGTKYDLRKYVIRFTSNEGQEAFSDAPSDDLRMAIWKNAAKKEGVIDLLKKSGWPEALIARLQGNITLYRPSTSGTRQKIAKKMVDQTLRELKEQHQFQDFQIDDQFYRTMGESFFSHSEGARSMRPVSSTEIVDLFSEALFDDIPPEDLKRATFRASLSDNYDGQHSFKGKTPPEREVKMTLQVEIPGKPNRVFERNLADVTPEKRLVHQREAVRIALHEAGHAVVNDPSLTEEATDFVTIQGKGGYGGYARYVDIPGASHNTTRQQAIAKIARVLAGGLAEERLSVGGRTSGWRSDKEKALRLAEKSVAEYGLTDKPLKLPQKDGQVIIEHPKTQKEIQAILEEAENFAHKRIDENLGAIRLIAARLVKKGFLSREDFEEVMSQASVPGFKGNMRINAKCGEYFRALTTR